MIGLDLLNLLNIAQVANGLDLVKIISYLTIGNYPLQEGKSYADQRGYSLGLIEQLDRAIEFARSLGEELTPTTHYLLGKRGNAAFRRGDYQLAAERYKEELQLSPDDARRAIVGSIFARTLAFCGRIEESHKYFETAHQLAQKLQDDELRGDVLGQESWAAGYMKDYETALRVTEQQLVLAEALHKRNGSEDYDTLAFALINFGSAKLELAKEGRGNVISVLDTHTRAKALAEKHGDARILALALKSLGEYFHYVGDRVLAQSNFSQALEIWHALNMIQEEQDLIGLVQELGYAISISKEEQDEQKA